MNRIVVNLYKDKRSISEQLKDLVVTRKVFDAVVFLTVGLICGLILVNMNLHYKNNLLSNEVEQYQAYIEMQEEQIALIDQYSQDLTEIERSLDDAQYQLDVLQKIRGNIEVYMTAGIENP